MNKPYILALVTWCTVTTLGIASIDDADTKKRSAASPPSINQTGIPPISPRTRPSVLDVIRDALTNNSVAQVRCFVRFLDTLLKNS